MCRGTCSRFLEREDLLTMRMLKNLIRFLLIGSCLWAASCSSREDAASTNQQERPAIAAAVQAHDFAPGQLEAHYQKHGDQFGGITREQYLAKARELLNAAVGNDILEKTRPNGDVMHFCVSSGEFAVMTPHGRIRTFFKTDMRYWMRQ